MLSKFWTQKELQEIPLQTPLTDAALHEKLKSLATLTSSEYCQKFLAATDEYASHKKGIVKWNKYSFGPGWSDINFRPYIVSLQIRLRNKAVKTSEEELFECLSESGGYGKDKKSLKFEVLVKMFDLDSLDYDDETAAKLIDDTCALLQNRLQKHRTQRVRP